MAAKVPHNARKSVEQEEEEEEEEEEVASN